MYSVIITGGDGQVGSSFQSANPYHDLRCISLSKSICDITKPATIEKVLKEYHPAVVINTAAYTNVDQAENERDLAQAINTLGSENLAKACHQFNVPLVHLSTDFVFDGEQTQPYLESAMPNPLNYYGLTKLQGELAVQQACLQHIIIRVSGVFGVRSRNFVKSIMNAMLQGKELAVVTDQVTCPTAAMDIALAALTVCRQIIQGNTAWGTYHYCGNSTISWFEYAKLITQCIAEHNAMSAPIIKPILTKDYKSLAQRPLRPILDCQKIKEVFSIERSDWRPQVLQLLPLLLKAQP